MNTKEIVERIMTMHWDMAACNCWICVNGREDGCRPKDDYLYDRRYARVNVVDPGHLSN